MLELEFLTIALDPLRCYLRRADHTSSTTPGGGYSWHNEEHYNTCHLRMIALILLCALLALYSFLYFPFHARQPYCNPLKAADPVV